jgi:hypothetical protein
MATILVNQKGTVWSVSATGGAASLPYTLCTYDLIPHRVRWESPTGAVSDEAIIQDAQGYVVYQEIISNTPFSFVEQRPTQHEKWSGYIAPTAPTPPNLGITVTRLDSGTLLIYL